MEYRAAVARICRDEALNWGEVYATADLHRVAPLVYSNLRQCPEAALQAPARERFEQALYHNVAAKEMIARKLVEVLAYFSRERIDVMLIKGGALDILVYEHPWYTVANDVDLVIRRTRDEADHKAIGRLLSGSSGIHFEYDYLEHHDVSMNGALPVDFQTIWRDAVEITFRGQRVLVMSREDTLISLCINSCRKRFFRLKSLCDIAETLRTYRAEMRWDMLADKARAYGCANIVYAALMVTSEMLGCAVPDELLRRLHVHPARARLIAYLSRRIPFGPLSSLYAGRSVLGRPVGPSLVLPYATYSWAQVWRKWGKLTRLPSAAAAQQG